MSSGPSALFRQVFAARARSMDQKGLCCLFDRGGGCRVHRSTRALFDSVFQVRFSLMEFPECQIFQCTVALTGGCWPVHSCIAFSLVSSAHVFTGALAPGTVSELSCWPKILGSKFSAGQVHECTVRRQTNERRACMMAGYMSVRVGKLLFLLLERSTGGSARVHCGGGSDVRFPVVRGMSSWSSEAFAWG